MMSASARMEIIEEQLDKLQDEHPVRQAAWLSLSRLLEAVEDFKRDLNKMDLARDET